MPVLSNFTRSISRTHAGTQKKVQQSTGSTYGILRRVPSHHFETNTITWHKKASDILLNDQNCYLVLKVSIDSK